MKAKNVLITTAIGLIALALGFVGGVKAEGSNFVSKGQIQSGDIFFDSSDFITLQSAYEIGKTEAYEAGKQEIMDNLPSYMGDYLNGRTASIQALNFSRGTTTITKNGFWIGSWFLRDTNGQSGDHEHGGTHHVTVTLYDADGSVKQRVLDVTYTSGYASSTQLLVVNAGDYVVMTDSAGQIQGYYACQSSGGQLLTFN